MGTPLPTTGRPTRRRRRLVGGLTLAMLASWLLVLSPLLLSLLLSHALLLTGLAGAPPFDVGETLRYDAKLGYFPVGTATGYFRNHVGVYT